MSHLLSIFWTCIWNTYPAYTMCDTNDEYFKQCHCSDFIFGTCIILCSQKRSITSPTETRLGFTGIDLPDKSSYVKIQEHCRIPFSQCLVWHGSFLNSPSCYCVAMEVSPSNQPRNTRLRSACVPVASISHHWTKGTSRTDVRAGKIVCVICGHV